MGRFRARACRVLLVLAAAAGLAAALPAAAPAALPPNDDFAAATDLGSGATATGSGSNVWATAEAGEPAHHGRFARASVWYRWTAPAAGVVSAATCGSTFDTILAVYRGPGLRALGRVASDDDTCDEQSVVRFSATAGTTYHLAVDGYQRDQGSIRLRLRRLSPPPNDAFAAASDLGDGPVASASGTNADATREAGEPAHHGRSPRSSVWYRWTAPASRDVELDTCGSDFDTILAVYAGPTLGAPRALTSDDDSCATQSRTRFESVAGDTYWIAVDSFGTEEGRIALDIQPANELRVLGLRRNSRRGIAELALSVPNPGRIALAATPGVRGATRSVSRAARVRLPVLPRGFARNLLERRGRATVSCT